MFEALCEFTFSIRLSRNDDVTRIHLKGCLNLFVKRLSSNLWLIKNELKISVYIFPSNYHYYKTTQQKKTLSLKIQVRAPKVVFFF